MHASVSPGNCLKVTFIYGTHRRYYCKYIATNTEAYSDRVVRHKARCELVACVSLAVEHSSDAGKYRTRITHPSRAVVQCAQQNKSRECGVGGVRVSMFGFHVFHRPSYPICF